MGVGLNGVGAMLRKQVSGAKWIGEVAGPWGESGVGHRLGIKHTYTNYVAKFVAFPARIGPRRP